MPEDNEIEIPDFSPDEFDNDKEVKKWRLAREEAQKYFDNCIKTVTDALQAKKSSHKKLKGFELHKLVLEPYVYESFAGIAGNKSIYISIIEYYTSTRTARQTSADFDEYFVGVITLDRTYPHTIIQPETLALKIHNLLIKTDIDFKHAKWFSFLFHVITKDDFRLKRSFEKIDLNRLKKFKSAEIELKDNQCYFRTGRKPVSFAEAKKFVELANTIAEIF